MADSDSGHEDDEFSFADLGMDDMPVAFGIGFCDFVVGRMMEDFGDEILLDLMFAIDRQMRWSSEILASQSEIEDLLLERHGAFDQNIWSKVQMTKAWSLMERRVYKVSRKCLAAAVDEVVLSEQQRS